MARRHIQTAAALAILSVLAAIYSLYLLYIGLPLLMKAPADKAGTYTLAIIIGNLSVTALHSLQRRSRRQFRTHPTPAV
jgi:hypothetical protein